MRKKYLALIMLGAIPTFQISGSADAAPPGPKVPLVFIPGYAASSPHPGTILQYAFNRGADPKTLDLSPSYAPFIRSLKNAGYVEGKTLFGAVYDWRMSLAPNDGEFDGKLNLVTAQEITSGDFSYAINYIGYWLDQAVQANPGVEYVDVVTHSTGGPLARAYVQSPAYGGAYIDKNGHVRHLPKIRYLILGACVHFGTVHSWRPWHADFQDVLAGFIPTTEIEGRFAAAAFALVSVGGEIPGPDYTITVAKILRKDSSGKLRPDPITFFRLYDPMRQSLMPTTDFLTPAGSNTPENVNNDPSVRSDLLLDLNAGSSPGNNPWAQTVGIPGIPGTPNRDGGVVNTFSSGARKKTRLLDFVIPGLVDLNPFICSATGIVQLSNNQGFFLPLIDLLRPNPAPIPVTESLFARVGDTETTQPLSGDGNGFFDSYEGYTYGDPHITRVQWGNGPYPATPPDQDSCSAPVSLPIPPSLPWDHITNYPVYHDVFFYNPDVRIFVVRTLTGQTPTPEQVITRHELRGLARFLNGRWLQSLSTELRFLDKSANRRSGAGGVR